MTTESTTASKTEKKNGQPTTNPGKPRAISSPNDVASLVLMQIDQVNAKKDDLTTAIKGLADTAKQLTRAYAQQQQVIAKLAKRVQELEQRK
jgi:predicted DNA-binding ArsR family transcriptional regulator